MAGIDWNTVEYETEEITDTDVKEIDEGSERIPVGRYLCKVIESSLKQINFKLYSCVGCRLKFEIEQAFEIEGKPVTGDEGEQYEGLHIFDDVAFGAPEEKDGMAKRRKMVALRLGIIRPGETLRIDHWRDDVIGKKVILQLEENVYTDKQGEEKVGNPRVGFFSGYHYADKSKLVAVDESEQWKDI